MSTTLSPSEYFGRVDAARRPSARVPYLALGQRRVLLLRCVFDLLDGDADGFAYLRIAIAKRVVQRGQ